MQNAIKLENISNLITPPSSYQCRHKVSAFCYSWPTQSHTSMECYYVCVLGIPKGKFSKQMENKYLDFKFVMTGCDFVMTGCDFVMTGCRNFRFIMTGCRNFRFIKRMVISIHIVVSWLINYYNTSTSVLFRNALIYQMY